MTILSFHEQKYTTKLDKRGDLVSRSFNIIYYCGLKKFTSIQDLHLLIDLSVRNGIFLNLDKWIQVCLKIALGIAKHIKSSKSLYPFFMFVLKKYRAHQSAVGLVRPWHTNKNIPVSKIKQYTIVAEYINSVTIVFSCFS